MSLVHSLGDDQFQLTWGYLWGESALKFTQRYQFPLFVLGVLIVLYNVVAGQWPVVVLTTSIAVIF